MIKLNQFTDLNRLPNFQSFHQFLHFLPGPSVFHIPGNSSAECQIVVTLLHGNEPSGLKALYQLIQQQFVPSFDTKFIVASVTAAKTEPEFSYRMLPNTRDLNRCFKPPYDDPQGKLAQAILAEVKLHKPRWIVDIHNTSGSGPAFSVAISMQKTQLDLASYFSQRIIVTDIKLGSLMECDLNCPVVTIEAGGAQDPSADMIALTGLQHLLSDTSLSRRANMEILNTPRRLELKSNTSLSYQRHFNNQFNVCMLPEIEKYNFGLTPAGSILGFTDKNELSHFVIDDHSDVKDILAIKNGAIITAQDLKLFMVTTRADIALSDCLFYFVKPET